MKKYKDDLILGIVMISFCLVTFVCTLAHNHYESTHYTTCGYVDSVTNNKILIVTPTGDIWSIDYMDNIHEGDLIELLFYNNETTEKITDDIIQHVRII